MTENMIYFLSGYLYAQAERLAKESLPPYATKKELTEEIDAISSLIVRGLHENAPVTSE